MQHLSCTQAVGPVTAANENSYEHQHFASSLPVDQILFDHYSKWRGMVLGYLSYYPPCNMS